MVYPFGEEAEIQDIFSKHYEKVNCHRDLDKKTQNFLENFQDFLHFCPNSSNFLAAFLLFPARWKLFVK